MQQSEERARTALWRIGGRRGLIALVVGALCAAFLLTGGGTASAAPPDSNRMATWNMQRASGRWTYALGLSDNASVVALQEASITPPSGAVSLGRIGRNIRAYRIPATRTRGERYLYILHQGANPARGVNPAMITSFRPNRVEEIAGVYRSALGVVRQADNTLFASIHASASGGTDAASLVRRVATRSRQLALGNWVVLGDFNRAPRSLPVGGTTGIPANSHIYENGGPTQLSGGRLDYAVSNVLTQNWQAARGNPRGSDHWPITFSSLRAGAGPARFTLGDNGGNGSVLDVYQARRTNGTHLILYHPDNGTNQQWTLRPDGFQHRSDRIVSVNSGKCVDVDNGTASKEGSRMNIWDCHRHGPTTDTQNFVLEHPLPLFPNLTTITNERTEYLLNVAGNGTADGTPVIQYEQQYGPLPFPADNEAFYLHPTS
ncbi:MULTISPECIES: RICIN domain-containing protein [unclassified Streptomyces]|uniref:RICIN domain-containing protein n=1 Tax=unclassified Streptomyces TaxID=2593676 RepID=UPI00324BA58E